MQSLQPSWKSSWRRTILRWWHSRAQRFAEWHFSRLYWFWRQWLSLIQFRIRRSLFTLREKWRETRDSGSILRVLTTTILGKVLFAVAVVISVEVLERLVLSYGPTIKTYIPLALQDPISTLKHLTKRDPATYASVLSTLAQVAGVFLALYFTAVSVAVSSVYSRVQEDVRLLLMRDKVGNHYINIVAFLAAYTTILLGLMALGYQPGVLSLILAVGIGVAGIFSFVILGFRSFQFFDPTNLVGYLVGDLTRWIQRATPSRPLWQDVSFQAYYQREAARVLATYRNVVSLANREEHLQSRALVELAGQAFSVLRFYEREKLRIPSHSKWFKSTYRHKEWLTASYSETSMAMRAGTVLQPEQAPDLMWFETDIVKTIVFSLEGLLERKDLSSAYDFFTSNQRTIEQLAKHYAIDEALYLFRRITPLIQQHVLKGAYPCPDGEENIETLKFGLALIDLHGLTFISILLGFSERIRNMTAMDLGNVVKNIRWERPQSIYETKLPRKVVDQMEFLKNGLEFERAVEGRYISPLWYQQEHVAISMVRFIDGAVATLTPELEKAFAAEVNTLLEDKRHLFAAQLIERGLEACDKFSHHFSEARECCERLEEFRRMKDMPWPSIDWDGYHRRIDSTRKALVGAFGTLLAHLAKLPKSKQFPDYFGHAYSVVAQECFDAIAKGDEAMFQKLFPVFFVSSIEVHKQCVASPVSNDPSVQFGFCAQPIIDLFDISGYAMIFQELDATKYWDFAKAIWDGYFSSLQDKAAGAQLFCALGTYRGFLITFPRDMTRAGWEPYLEWDLRRRNLLRNIFYDPFSSTQDQRSAHSSPIVRALGRSGMLFDEARKFFSAVYFKEQIERGELEVSNQIQSVYREIERESSSPDKEDG